MQVVDLTDLTSSQPDAVPDAATQTHISDAQAELEAARATMAALQAQLQVMFVPRPIAM